MKRFYKKVTTSKTGEGFSVALDGKAIKTPMKLLLEVPTAKLAKAIAKEWHAQKEDIDPHSMPMTRLANTAIDRTAMHKGIVIDEVMNFSRHDLLCYRAEEGEDLEKLEAAAWDPYLAWALEGLGLKLKTTSGIESIAQDEASLARLKGMLEVLGAFPLTALHNATTLSGSAILALALWEGFQNPADIWTAAHVDETYQIDRWGEDAEARKAFDAKSEMWFATADFFEALK